MFEGKNVKETVVVNSIKRWLNNVGAGVAFALMGILSQDYQVVFSILALLLISMGVAQVVTACKCEKKEKIVNEKNIANESTKTIDKKKYNLF